MESMFRRAERKKAYLKLGISAPSGAGKTYSALLIAKGLCGNWEKVALIDTENGSGELYSHLGGYSVCRITPPYTPQKYMGCIENAVECGFKAIIIDSLSHAWTGDGGLLEMHDKAAGKGGNSYAAWREITPQHNKLVDTILQAEADVIVTTRAKADYLQTEENGKKAIKKVGLAPIFRDGLEYEMTVFFDLSQDHYASASKDRTGLFDGRIFVPTEKIGEELDEWRKSGAEPPKYYCSVCGKEISQKTNEQSLKKYGAALCSKECLDKFQLKDQEKGE